MMNIDIEDSLPDNIFDTSSEDESSVHNSPKAIKKIINKFDCIEYELAKMHGEIEEDLFHVSPDALLTAAEIAEGSLTQKVKIFDEDFNIENEPTLDNSPETMESVKNKYLLIEYQLAKMHGETEDDLFFASSDPLLSAAVMEKRRFSKKVKIVEEDFGLESKALTNFKEESKTDNFSGTLDNTKNSDRIEKKLKKKVGDESEEDLYKALLHAIKMAAKRLNENMSDVEEDISNNNLNKEVIPSTEQTVNKPFECEKCGKVFSGKAYLRDHLKTYSDGRQYQCKICSTSFKQLSNFLKHKRSVHGDDKRYKCGECENIYSRKRRLDFHVKAAHTGERPYKCNKCEATFVYPHLLTRHSKIHTGSKPFLCEVCGKAFTSRDNHNSHRFTHSNISPFECSVWGAGFTRKPYLYKHIKSQGQLNDTIVVNQPRLSDDKNNGKKKLERVKSEEN